MARRGKNEGTIFKKKNGKWRAQVSISGKRISKTFATRLEAAKWLRENLNLIDKGMTFEAQTLTLDVFLQEWIQVKKSAVRVRTGFQYERLINLYIKPALGKVKLKDITPRVVNQFYEALKARGIGVSHIRYAHRVLHAALEQALKDGFIGRNPAHGATVPKPAHREMSILNEQQVGLFLVAASNSKFKTLYHLAIATGMRFSELRGLHWSDVDWVKSVLAVNRQIQDVPGQGSIAGAPKTHSGIRKIRLGETSLDSLREQKLEVERIMSDAGDSWRDNDLIFPSKVGTPFVSMSLHHDFVSVLKAAGLPRIRFHDLRHTAASLMLAHGVPVLVVSKILGHSSPSITLNVYAHASVEMQDKAANIMDEIITPIPVSISQLHPSAPADK